MKADPFAEMLARPKTAEDIEDDRRLVADLEIDMLAARDEQPDEAHYPLGNPFTTHTFVPAMEREVARLDGTGPTKTWGATLSTALTDVRAALGAQSLTERTPLFVPASDLFSRGYPPTPWQVTGLITRGSHVTIGGEPKAATKTWLATEIAVAIATGTPVCGEFPAIRGRAAYFYAEDFDKQIRNRIRALMAGRGLPPVAPDGLFCCPRGKSIDVTRDEDLALIVASVRDLGGVDLLVLDPLRDVSSAAEDKSDEMAPVMKRLRVLGTLLTCTVATPHHAGKQTESTAKRRPGQRLRGSGAIHGSTDCGIYLEDSDGNGSTVFRNVLKSEVKGARSAGVLDIALTIEDDELGEANKAGWTVSRSEKGKGATGADDDKVFQFIRDLAIRGERLSRRKLRDHDDRPIAEKRIAPAIDRMIEAGRLELDGSVVVIPGDRRT